MGDADASDPPQSREHKDEAVADSFKIRQRERRERIRSLHEDMSAFQTVVQQAQAAWIEVSESVPTVTNAVTSEQIACLVEPLASAEAHARALADGDKETLR